MLFSLGHSEIVSALETFKLFKNSSPEEFWKKSTFMFFIDFIYKRKSSDT